MRLENFDKLVSEELQYIAKYEQKVSSGVQNENKTQDAEENFCPWLKSTAHESDGDHEMDKQKSCYSVPVKKWTSEMVQEWLADKGVQDGTKLKSLDGLQLIELATLRQKSYETFWNEMRSYFQLSMQDCLVISCVLKTCFDED